MELDEIPEFAKGGIVISIHELRVELDPSEKSVQ